MSCTDSWCHPVAALYDAQRCCFIGLGRADLVGGSYRTSGNVSVAKFDAVRWVKLITWRTSATTLQPNRKQHKNIIHTCLPGRQTELLCARKGLDLHLFWTCTYSGSNDYRTSTIVLWSGTSGHWTLLQKRGADAACIYRCTHAACTGLENGFEKT